MGGYERRVDIVVCGVGTGGTIPGIGEALKPGKPELKRGERYLSADLWETG
jgi:cysteine synthase